MSEKRKVIWYSAAWIFIFMLLVVSCQSSDQPAILMPVNETDVEFPTSTTSAANLAPLPPTLTQTTIPSQDNLITVQDPSWSADDCSAASLPGIACTGVSTNHQWVPLIREFGGIPMALVPAGCFMMGSSDEQISQYLPMLDHPGIYADEQPAHLQCFEEPFWIDVYEVTNGFYGSYGWWHDNDQPRESVTWFEANAYCNTRELAFTHRG